MILNRNNATQIFSKGGAHDFMAEGGTKITSSGSMDVANPELSFVANKTINNGGTMLSSAQTYEAPRLQMLMLDNERISGDMGVVDPVKAMEMVEKADKEVAARNAMVHAARKTY